jgi:RNA polymerase sigma factor (sigma-70 family)
MDRSDAQLIAAYIEGDEGAFELLVERHLRAVYSFVARFVGSTDEAEDITQETFLKAWRSARKYRAEASSFKTWVLRIARNSAIDYLRKKKHVPLSAFDTADGQNVLAEITPDERELPSETFARAQDVESLSRALQKLHPSAREVLLLHYTNGLTFLEIGDMLGEKANTIKSRHHRAVLQLRSFLSTISPGRIV